MRAWSYTKPFASRTTRWICVLNPSRVAARLNSMRRVDENGYAVPKLASSMKMRCRKRFCAKNPPPRFS